MATATVSDGVITAITVTQTGESYAATPTVTIFDLAGTGSGATATAVMEEDGNGGFKVVSIVVGSGGSGYSQPIVSIGTPSVGQETADEQLYNEATTAYNVVLATPGLGARWFACFHNGQLRQCYHGSNDQRQPAELLRRRRQPAHYNALAESFFDSAGDTQIVRSVAFPLVIDYTLAATEIAFDLEMPGLPIEFTAPGALDLTASAQPHGRSLLRHRRPRWLLRHPRQRQPVQRHARRRAGRDFTNSVTVGILSGTMTADVGDIFAMGFSTTLTDPNGDGQITLQEVNSLPRRASSRPRSARP